MNAKYSIYALMNRYAKLPLMIVVALSMLTIMSGAAQDLNGGDNVICQIYELYETVQTAIFVLGILLMILGAALYAGANLMPAQSRGSLQGYGMGMVLGGVAGVILAILAPFILTTVGGAAYTNAISNAIVLQGECPALGT